MTGNRDEGYWDFVRGSLIRKALPAGVIAGVLIAITEITALATGLSSTAIGIINATIVLVVGYSGIVLAFIAGRRYRSHRTKAKG